MKRINKYIPLLGIAALLFGCYPKGPEFYSDLDLVSTNYDPDYWGSAQPKTYYMPDSLGYIIDRENPDNNDTIVFNNDDIVLDAVADNLESMGYERLDTIDANNIPDVVVFTQVVVVKNTSVGWIPWYPWWGGGYPWWPGYYPGYPWGGTPVAYTYSTGTVIIDMIDAPNIDLDTPTFPVTWSAGINGLLRDQSSSNQSTIIRLIDQAFNQSPYLDAN